jgi:hypothetical protein
MTTDLQIALAPAATFERLAHVRTTGRAGALAGRLLLALAIIGTSVAAAATSRVSIELVGGIGISWSFALLVQLLAAAAIIVPARTRTVTALRAFELWFQAHVPWSLWFLLPALYFALAGRRVTETPLALAALVPLAWTIVLLHAFAVRVLRSRRAAAIVLLHQGIVWGFTLCYIVYAIGGWDRVLEEVGL